MDGDPLAGAERLDRERRDGHGAELGEGAEALGDGRALEDDEHEEGEEGVVPVLVQTPQRDAEDLEDEEGGGGVLAEELEEGGDGDVELVLAVGSERVGDLEALEAGGGDVGGERRVRVGRVRAERELDRGAVGGDGGDGVGVALVVEGPGAGIGRVLLHQRHDLALSAVLGGHDANAIGVLERFRPASLNPSPCAGVPPGDQKGEGVARADGDAGQKSPLLALEPVVVFDVVSVCEEGVKREGGERIDVQIPRDRHS